MRIEYLHMKNFAPFLVALDKTSVTLDYRGIPDKMINIFVGQMGSCKTFLLGHHQPFATLGTLDVRNSEDMVLPDKRGVKEITYRKGEDIFEIVHIYTPTKTGHSVKSYIKRNGIELNENGNSSSFKQIIEAEFGLDQNFLKLFRIGSNVINLPDMSSSERKNFISSMLADTEIYTLLYKKIGEENRSINAQMTLLVNKLHAISPKGEADLQNDKDAEEVITKDVRKQIDETSREIYRLEGSISAIQDGLDSAAFQSRYLLLKTQAEGIEQQAASLQSELDSIKDYPDPDEVNKKIAQCHARMDVRQAQITKLERTISDYDARKSQIKDKLAILGSPEHIQTLKENYDRLMTTLNEYERKLKRFTYQGSMGSVTSLIIELQNLDSLIADVSQYDVDVLKEILRNKRGSLSRAEREITKANKAKDKIHQEMENISQVTTYKPTHPMVRPFNCPTEDCPFYKYHPVTEQRINRTRNVDKVFLERRNQLNQLDAVIYRYEAYPDIVRKLDTIEQLWKTLYKKAKELSIVVEDDMAEVITNIVHRHWYDSTKLYRIKELCGIREKYYELTQKVASMKNELTQYELNDVNKLNAELTSVTRALTDACKQMEDLEGANTKDKDELNQLNDAYLKISNLTILQQQLKALQDQAASLHKDLALMEEKMKQVEEFSSTIAELKTTLTRLNGDYAVHANSLETLIRKLNDIRITKAQYDETIQQQQIIHDILDAVSSKKGIPLAFVKLFLADCKDILNDLISDVFDDVIEIQDFDIPDDGSDFNIPYTRNGARIDDIIKSSQGERAVISLALSFALIRQSTFPYNIMLLDEVDGPLDKNARNKFITILFKQLQAIQAEQVFIVSHNNTFDGFNVNIILTSNELVDENPLTTVMKV